MSEKWAQRLRLLGVAGVAAPAAMVLVGFVLSWLFRRQVPDLLRPPDWQIALLGALTALVSMGLVTLLYKSSKTFEKALRESGTRVGEEALRLAGYPVMLVVVVMAGLGEEVLFRGGLQPAIGVVPAALLFGFSHGGWRREMWAYVVAAAISGTLFGTVYQVTGNLWVPIIAHALHNVLSTALLGKRFEVSRKGFWPVVRLVPEVEEEESASPDEPALPDEPTSRDEPAFQDELPAAAAVEESSAEAWDDDPAGEWSAWTPEAEAGVTDPQSLDTPEEAPIGDEPVAEPLPAETDRPDDGPDDRHTPHRPAE